MHGAAGFENKTKSSRTVEVEDWISFLFDSLHARTSFWLNVLFERQAELVKSHPRDK